MERVLIVAKTRMKNGSCVSGLVRSSNKGVRLLPKDRSHHATETEFEVGQVWNMMFRQASHLAPPHLEDVIVLEQQYIARVHNIHEILMQRIRPWRGGPDCLFDGLITIGPRKCYISKSGPIPSCSTGYWLPDRPLVLHEKNGKHEYWIEYQDENSQTRTLIIPFVGFASPIEQISPGTLVRVSLARWFAQSDEEKKCYLQLSGWYERKQ